MVEEAEPLICEPGGYGLIFPAGGDAEARLPHGLRAALYAAALLFCFLGVSIVADMFMAAIEEITSRRRRVLVKNTGRYRTELVWNGTVANLTLMALGSSAPEILLSVVETLRDGCYSGELGPSTIVGSAAFNLLVIIAACIVAIPSGETRRIKEMNVFIVTAIFSMLAYVWLLVIVQVHTPEVVDIWEAVVTLLLLPLLVFLSYLCDIGFFSRGSREAMGEGKDEALAPGRPSDLSEDSGHLPIHPAVADKQLMDLVSCCTQPFKCCCGSTATTATTSHPPPAQHHRRPSIASVRAAHAFQALPHGHSESHGHELHEHGQTQQTTAPEDCELVTVVPPTDDKVPCCRLTLDSAIEPAPGTGALPQASGSSGSARSGAASSSQSRCRAGRRCSTLEARMPPLPEDLVIFDRRGRPISGPAGGDTFFPG
mmetsp:Transcript_62540/g.177601  ORF Transcript_62540/g.177601 Transcript_62540/m.177601 type:complete len:428 (+) Transcript_62540:11-1294(+)